MLSRNARRLRIACAAGLCVAVAAIYFQTREFKFTNYDDNVYITQNPMVYGGLSARTVAWSFKTGYAANWHPMTWLSHALDCSLFGMESGPAHLVNALFHAANAVLLFWVLQLMTGAIGRSAAVAFLFAVHPLNVQSVAWLAERKNLLSTLFALLALWMYTAYVRRRTPARYASVCTLLALSLMSKPMFVTFPFLLLLLDFWPLNRIRLDGAIASLWRREARALFLEKLPLFAIAAASSIVTFLVQHRAGATEGTETIPFLYRVANALTAYMSYIVKTVWPFNLAAFYPHPIERVSAALACASFVALTIMSWFAIRQHRARPYVPVAWFWYLGALVPVIGIVQVGSQAMADRYAYVPVIGLFILAAWGLPDALAPYSIARKALPCVAAVSVALLAARAYDETQYWRDDETLWTHAVAVTRDNRVAHSNLASALNRAGRPAEAIPHIQEALRIAPGHPSALITLGLILMDQNKLPEAVQAFSQAIQNDPRSTAAHLNLGMALMRMQRFREAEQHFARAVELEPNDPRAYNSMGVLFAAQRQRDSATLWFRRALAIDPLNASAQRNLQRLEAEFGPGPRPEQ